MKTKLLLILLLLSAGFESLTAAKTFKTEIISSEIKTLRIQVADDWLAPPVIELEGGVPIEISFDRLGVDRMRYTYTLTHCNADWTPSSLIQSEYMSGFQQLLVEDYTNSYNTKMEYVNYKVFLPNQDMTMKVSGNYVVQVYREDDPNTVVLSACFSVIEPIAKVAMNVTSSTDIDFNKTHQQVSFAIDHGDQVKSPMQEIKTYVMQNNRRDNEASLVQPLRVEGKKLIYEHNKDLIFDAGNEYRRFEMITHRYKGINIEKVEYHSPYYHVDILPEQVRANRFYSYDEDINGKFFIRTTEGVDYDIEADYHFVHFYFPCSEPFKEDIYMLSEIFNNNLNDQSKLKYNFENKAYEMNLLLKQGSYNYLFVNKKSGSSKGNTALIEGDYFQTENEYLVLVYHRPFGGRYDRLIGMQMMRTAIK